MPMRHEVCGTRCAAAALIGLVSADVYALRCVNCFTLKAPKLDLNKDRVETWNITDRVQVEIWQRKKGLVM